MSSSPKLTYHLFFQASVSDTGRQIDRNLLISPPSEISSASGPEEVIVREAFKEDNHIVINWESETRNILGFRVVYRLFGKPEFKQGPPLAPSEREFRIKNVPANVSRSK